MGAPSAPRGASATRCVRRKYVGGGIVASASATWAQPPRNRVAAVARRRGARQQPVHRQLLLRSSLQRIHGRRCLTRRYVLCVKYELAHVNRAARQRAASRPAAVLQRGGALSQHLAQRRRGDPRVQHEVRRVRQLLAFVRVCRQVLHDVLKASEDRRACVVVVILILFVRRGRIKKVPQCVWVVLWAAHAALGSVVQQPQQAGGAVRQRAVAHARLRSGASRGEKPSRRGAGGDDAVDVVDVRPPQPGFYV
jgi:hypothetical protein